MTVARFFEDSLPNQHHLFIPIIENSNLPKSFFCKKNKEYRAIKGLKNDFLVLDSTVVFLREIAVLKNFQKFICNNFRHYSFYIGITFSTISYRTSKKKEEKGSRRVSISPNSKVHKVIDLFCMIE